MLRSLMLPGAAIVLGTIAHAGAQTYPDKPVRLIVAFPAGGAADLVGRAMAQKLS